MKIPAQKARLVSLSLAVTVSLLAGCGSGTDRGSGPGSESLSRHSAAQDAQPREFTLVATGDILLHERLWNQARQDASRTGEGPEDFAPQLESIAPVVSGAGLAICHLETPLAPEGGPYRGYPAFSSPPTIVPALARTGYDACTTASNHTFDAGADGVDRTLDRLDEAGLAHAGSARSKEEAETPTLIDVDTDEGAVRVGLLSYTYGFNGIPHPGGDTWRGNEIDEDRILAEAAAAREAGAEFVVVAMHWGDEYAHEPNAQQLEGAPRLLASPDIDLLLGHHAHVVQPVERIDGQWVVYGLGNLMAAHRTPGQPRQEGLLMRFTITEDPAQDTFTTTGAEYLPLLQTDDPPVRVVNVPGALAGGEAASAAPDALQTAMDRTTEIVLRRGAAEDGLTLLDD
ncbi:CapA family protein [Streptomyces sp. ACA25]|uniref:CapA family protein n=1 Tax=Streptomyces sp. ACA25 TaxID=3022596 RepID=UPI002306DE61|nr:CapA family protein [Streptomyces sp. ACA25]MDB1087183.1 CapA family protein [Streptomyces sp. ACA25]